MDDNQAIAARFLQAWSAGGLAVVDELADSDIIVSYTHFPTPVQGRETFKKILSDTIYCFPDLEIAADEVLAGGDKVAVRWTYTGTHHHGEVFGVAPKGKRVRVSGITFYRIRDGKVVEETGIVDVLALMQQLGGSPYRNRS